MCYRCHSWRFNTTTIYHDYVFRSGSKPLTNYFYFFVILFTYFLSLFFQIEFKISFLNSQMSS